VAEDVPEPLRIIEEDLLETAADDWLTSGPTPVDRTDEDAPPAGTLVVIVDKKVVGLFVAVVVVVVLVECREDDRIKPDELCEEDPAAALLPWGDETGVIMDELFDEVLLP
jgi:hypothetical protein